MNINITPIRHTPLQFVGIVAILSFALAWPTMFLWNEWLVFNVPDLPTKSFYETWYITSIITMLVIPLYYEL